MWNNILNWRLVQAEKEVQCASSFSLVLIMKGLCAPKNVLIIIVTLCQAMTGREREKWNIFDLMFRPWRKIKLWIMLFLSMYRENAFFPTSWKLTTLHFMPTPHSPITISFLCCYITYKIDWALKTSGLLIGCLLSVHYCMGFPRSFVVVEKMWQIFVDFHQLRKDGWHWDEELQWEVDNFCVLIQGALLSAQAWRQSVQHGVVINSQH